MSSTEHEVSISTDCPAPPFVQRFAAHNAVLGEGMQIRRALPNRERRMIGAWCFLDHFGPVDIGAGKGMRVGPHPHIGLQTFSWLLEGEVYHRDSLGFEQLIRPGQVNLMTAGHGISHSEESPPNHSAIMHGAQLWIALPDEQFERPPAFEHYPSLPEFDDGGYRVTVLAGEFMGHVSPARVYTPLLGLDLNAASAAATTLPLRRDFEYGAIVLVGEARLNGETLVPGECLYFGCGHDALQVETDAATRILIVGGEPFKSERILYWNFVGRNGADIREATDEWNAGDARFGEVHGYDGDRLPAPAVPKLRGE
ncbi:pirin family protein [Jeongeupia chitinilytica]|uniref:Quercetin 2,3-dioxygenase n=1 Tax=Jeongeupia chitinilytica TaxID=1041641 RepID=A0ABQ3H5I4_9NEIS|nr:pirin family protein [Jeongeupia chitinilytica]GHD65808.1 quercetin 2,3-dioxygenase [Jeongeupia chitinilytica]